MRQTDAAMFLEIILCVCFISSTMEDRVKANINDIKIKIDDLFRKFSSLQTEKTYCSMVLKDPCGKCKCVDDYRHEKKYYCDCRGLAPMKDCREFYDNGIHYNGIYFITINKRFLTQVFCDQETNPGGWIVFQRRRDGSVSFYKGWQEYKDGFGDIRNEFWLGNDNLFRLTHRTLLSSGNTLRIDLYHPKRGKLYFNYKAFEIGSEITEYKIHVSALTSGSNMKDRLSYHKGLPFRTYDKDANNCANRYHTGWWFGDCFECNLNGMWYHFGTSHQTYLGIQWDFDKYGLKDSFTFSEMKLRRN